MPHHNSDDVRISGTILHSGTASTASIELGVWDEKNLEPYFKMTMSGSAKVHYDDHFNLEVGQKLALGRALVALGNKLIRQANKALASDIHNREHAAKARTRRIEWQKKKTEERTLRRIAKEMQKKQTELVSSTDNFQNNGNDVSKIIDAVTKTYEASEKVQVRGINPS